MMGLGMMAITLSFQSCWDDDDDCPRHVICPVEQPNALVTVKPNADDTAFRMQLNDSTELQKADRGRIGERWNLRRH